MRFISLNLCLLLIVGCSHMGRRQIADYSSWHYQLQGYTKNLKAPLWDQKKIFVVDPDEIKGTDLLKRTKTKGIVVAYLSIGEAERYRDYFGKMDKDLILFENKNWPGNYKVKFWEAKWQKIILQKLKQIIEAGYDGVYLDIVDAFYEIKPHQKRAGQMRDFLGKIREYSSKLNSNFVMIQQNAPTLYEYLIPDEKDSYFALIDGIAYEDCFFYGSEDHDNTYNPQEYCLKSMQEFSKRGKFILSVEYLKDKSLQKNYLEEVSRFKSQNKINSLIPFTGPRALDGQ
jgi:cysteinyl-tRNA synthetase